MITREAKTDLNGVFSFTLDESGVWVIAVANTIPGSDGEFDKDIRGILMVPMEEPFPEEYGLINDEDETEDEDHIDQDELATLKNLAYIAVGLGALGFLLSLVAITRRK
jgi:hypothetical protein